MAELNDYELQRQRNIAANLAILASLGLEKPAAAVTKRKPPPTPKTEVVKREVLKREVREKKRSLEEDGNDEVGQVESGRRKSARLSAVVSFSSFVWFSCLVLGVKVKLDILLMS